MANTQYFNGTGANGYASPCYQACASYAGPGSANIYRGQASCNDYTHTEYNQRNGANCTGPWVNPGAPSGIFLSVDANGFFTGDEFKLDLLEFLKGDTTLAIGDYEYCEAICTQPCEPKNYNQWTQQKSYNLGQIVQYGRECYQSLISGNTAEPTVGAIENYTGNTICGAFSGTGYTQTWLPLSIAPLSFDGGNDFRPREDCTDLVEIPDVPQFSGTGFTTNPVIFKDGIYNIGGQDCFDSSYMVGDDFLDPCNCDATVMSADTQLFGVFADGVEDRKSVNPGTSSLLYFNSNTKVCCGADTKECWTSLSIRTLLL